MLAFLAVLCPKMLQAQTKEPDFGCDALRRCCYSKVNVRKLKRSDLAKLPEIATQEDVRRIFGDWLCTEGAVLIYPIDEGQTKEAWFWQAPISPTDAKSGYKISEVSIDWIVAWPPSLEGQPLQKVFDDYKKKYGSRNE